MQKITCKNLHLICDLLGISFMELVLSREYVTLSTTREFFYTVAKAYMAIGQNTENEK